MRIIKKLNYLVFFRKIIWIFYKKKLKNCKLLVLDVDGVLTDGSLHYDGKNINRIYCVNDGIGLKFLMKYGIQIALISGGLGESIERRAIDLGIENYFIGVKNKLEVLKNLQKKLKIKKSESIYMGDDLNDIVVKSQVSMIIAPLNGQKYIGDFIDCVTNNKGGEGSVREVCDKILRCKGVNLQDNDFEIRN